MGQHNYGDDGNFGRFPLPYLSMGSFMLVIRSNCLCACDLAAQEIFKRPMANGH